MGPERYQGGQSKGSESQTRPTIRSSRLTVLNKIRSWYVEVWKFDHAQTLVMHVVLASVYTKSFGLVASEVDKSCLM